MPPARKPKSYPHRYGLKFPIQLPDWLLELRCWTDRYQTGVPPFNHLHSALRLMFPDNVWHDWTEDRFRAFCNPEYEIRDGPVLCRVFSWMGCGAAGKTRDAVLLALAWWISHPDQSIVTMTSTTKDSCGQRMWPVLQSHWNDLTYLDGVEGPHVVPSSMRLEAIRGERKHAIYIQAVKGGELTDAIANIQGRHAPRMFVVVDEAMGTPEAVFAALPNVFKGATEVNLLFLSNAPLTRHNPFMKLAEPEGGWSSVSPAETFWRTKPIDPWQIPRGVCLHFSGQNSPNVKAGKTIYPFLYSFENWRRVEGNAEIAKTPQFWSQDLGFPPPEGALFTVLTESLVEAKDGRGRHTFMSWAQPIAGLDPSFGNDECKLVFGVMGDISGGLQGIQVAEHMTIQIDVTAKDSNGRTIPPEYQIAHRVMSECQARAIPPTRLGVMAGGNPGVIGVLLQEWGDVVSIQESGAASEAPASTTDPRPANEVYDRRVSELYFLVRSLVEGAQLKGLYDDAIEQLCARLYDIEKSRRRLCIEMKADFKPRFGRSPDDAEAIIAMCAVARDQGVEPAGLLTNRPQMAIAQDESGEDEKSIAALYDEDTRANDPFDGFMAEREQMNL